MPFQRSHTSISRKPVPLTRLSNTIRTQPSIQRAGQPSKAFRIRTLMAENPSLLGSQIVTQLAEFGVTLTDVNTVKVRLRDRRVSLPARPLSLMERIRPLIRVNPTITQDQIITALETQGLTIDGQMRKRIRVAATNVRVKLRSKGKRIPRASKVQPLNSKSNASKIRAFLLEDNTQTTGRIQEQLREQGIEMNRHDIARVISDAFRRGYVPKPSFRPRNPRTQVHYGPQPFVKPGTTADRVFQFVQAHPSMNAIDVVRVLQIPGVIPSTVRSMKSRMRSVGFDLPLLEPVPSPLSPLKPKRVKSLPPKRTLERTSTIRKQSLRPRVQPIVRKPSPPKPRVREIKVRKPIVRKPKIREPRERELKVPELKPSKPKERKPKLGPHYARMAELLAQHPKWREKNIVQTLLDYGISQAMKDAAREVTQMKQEQASSARHPPVQPKPITSIHPLTQSKTTVPVRSPTQPANLPTSHVTSSPSRMPSRSGYSTYEEFRTARIKYISEFLRQRRTNGGQK